MLLTLALLGKYTDREVLRNIVSSYGILGNIIFISVSYLFVVLVPGYNTPIHIAAGYIFGPELGWVFNFIATTAGLFTIIWLVKKYGRPLVERLVKTKYLEKYDSILQKIGPISLFILYVLPGLPDDEVTYLLSASPKVNFKRFILPVILGTAAKTSVSYIGDQGSAGIIHSGIARIIGLVVGLIVIGIQESFFVKKKSD